MSFLQFLTQSSKTDAVFPNHPARRLDVVDKVNYLNGLAVLMNIDDSIAPDEKEYLATLIQTFALPEDKLNEFVEFASNPILEMVKYTLKETLRSREIMFAFMIDCLILSYKDGVIHENEKKLMDFYFKTFEIGDSIREQIYYCHDKIKEQEDKWQFESLTALSAQLQ